MSLWCIQPPRTCLHQNKQIPKPSHSIRVYMQPHNISKLVPISKQKK